MMKLFLSAVFAVMAGVTALIVRTAVSDNPQEAAAKALAALAEQRIFAVDYSIDTWAPVPKNFADRFGVASVPVTVRGQVDADPSDRPVAVGKLTVAAAPFFPEAILPKIDWMLTADGGRFFKLSRLGLLKKVGLQVDALSDAWMTDDPAEVRTFVGLEKTFGDKKAIPAVWRSLITIMTGGELFSVKGKLTGENIGGIPTRRYDVEINRSALAQAIADVLAAQAGLMMNEQGQDAFKQALLRAQAVRGEIWIDRNEGKLRRFGVTVVPAPQDWPSAVTVLIDFRQPKDAVEAKAPASAKTPRELLLPVIKNSAALLAPASPPR
ncbi:hypothetical protein HY633_03465 [Candidatus Uhrbacteria bacterium]|nr:hypothetical protein [Candidatus Uhrbacteria bacterium]